MRCHACDTRTEDGKWKIDLRTTVLISGRQSLTIEYFEKEIIFFCGGEDEYEREIFEERKDIFCGGEEEWRRKKMKIF